MPTFADTPNQPYHPPRLSTPAGGDDRWDEPDPFVLQEVTPAHFVTKPSTSTALTLSLPDLGLAKAKDWGTAYAPAPEYVPSTAAQVAKEAKAAQNRSGGSGISAYGYSGVTGLAGQRGPSPYGFQEPMWMALGKANAAMKAAGLGTFGITDGWRSYEAQVALKKKKPNLAATPGRSIHGLGLAADLRATKAQKGWLRQHAQEFGLYFPFFEKEDWHIQLLPELWTGSW